MTPTLHNQWAKKVQLARKNIAAAATLPYGYKNSVFSFSLLPGGWKNKFIHSEQAEKIW
jgi:hypothetical protein